MAQRSTVLITLLMMAWASHAYAVVKPRSVLNRSVDFDAFPTDLFVRKQVAFWQLVFQKYPSSVSLIHDLDEPSILVDIVDLQLLSELKISGKNLTRDEFNRLTKSYVRRYQMAVERFKDEREGALKYGAIEDRLYQVYRRDPRSLARLYKGQVVIRAQQGLADTFVSAAQSAQQYLPYMERTFASYGLPTKLTRLPFVESMFNLNARSKVGASGIWQFMPETARLYMNVDAQVDERNSPFKATRAAALFMIDNYKELGSWPLAITAYNHGRAGLEKASKIFQTKDLGQIIQRYESPSFGFASKNFYAEFLAAANTYDFLVRQKRIAGATNLTQLEEVTIPGRYSIAQIIDAAKIPREQLVQFNPCLTGANQEYHFQKPLPANYQLWLPRYAAASMKRHIAQLSRGQRTSNPKISRR